MPLFHNVHPNIRLAHAPAIAMPGAMRGELGAHMAHGPYKKARFKANNITDGSRSAATESNNYTIVKFDVPSNSSCCNLPP